MTPEPGEPDPACYLSGRLEFAFILSLASYFGSSGRFFWHATCNFLRMRIICHDGFSYRTLLRSDDCDAGHSGLSELWPYAQRRSITAFRLLAVGAVWGYWAGWGLPIPHFRQETAKGGGTPVLCWVLAEVSPPTHREKSMSWNLTKKLR